MSIERLEEAVKKGLKIEISTHLRGSRRNASANDRIIADFKYEGRIGYCEQEADDFNFEELVPYVDLLLIDQ